MCIGIYMLCNLCIYVDVYKSTKTLQNQVILKFMYSSNIVVSLPHSLIARAELWQVCGECMSILKELQLRNTFSRIQKLQ